MTLLSDNRHAHLRANAAAQKQTTVDRLSQAIADGREVSTFTIKEVSGMDYMVYYRNRDAFQLFQEHSTHLCKEREQEQAKEQESLRRGSRKTGKGQATAHAVKVSPRDPLLDYKRPRLVELLHEAQSARDEAKRQLRTERCEAEQYAQAERTDLEQCYHKLLQEHMFGGVDFSLPCNVREQASDPPRETSVLHTWCCGGATHSSFPGTLEQEVKNCETKVRKFP